MTEYFPFKKCDGPKYDPDMWDLSTVEHEKNNCYTYAVINDLEDDIIVKRQPGEKCGLKFEYDCKNLEEMIKCDFPEITKIDTIDSYVPCNHYRIALVLDKSGEFLDYHFYRQDLDGYWSHKTGHDPISNVDASNKKILNPQYIDRNYDKENNDRFNYDVFCGYYSVPYNGK